ncbi:hypothetical protein KAN89_004256 [Salmonella enterica subsp. enterica serovar Heidelberg]|nr:hypothetical protein [Salmonella enterica subsp. enterica serovar Infantis]ECY2760416.1 hypothetical protein [Salmonella enterica]EHL4683484.1 hypothetical protein [Salmonella enterica subsp. enterica serovar Heidelberg]EHF4723460.1 hypothetical protein [Salmonella enterica subsp. enterica serovar Infantis]EHG4718298.1 hypothetical protein [Salmonella enterica subsp. enterica serovar Infantis]
MKFSESFNMEFQQSNLDFIDIPLDTDLQFFIDPTSIRALKTNWGGSLEKLIQDYFADVLASIKNGDLKRAGILLSSLKESNSFHLGYSSKKSSGKALGVKTAELILDSLKKSKAAQSGLLHDLEDTALTIDGIASDRISDSVCNILKLPFIEYTQKICEFYNVDTSDVSGIRLWDPNSGRWVKRTFKLPIYNGEEVILIPKVLAREKIAYSHSKFYRRYIIPEIRAEHIKAGSALVTLLKGKQTVTAKKIIEEFGQSKGFIEEQIVKYPDAIKQYKEELLLSPPPPLPHKSFDDSTGAVTSPLSSDIENLKLSIKENDEQLYVGSLKKIFLTIFYPSLFYPCLISGNMNDYRFTMLNESRAGFFFDFSVFEIPAEKILVNIVMSSSHINENYLESLTQEMDVIKTSVCLLACCEATNELQKEKIKALAKSKGKYIFIINSVAINGILDEYYKIGEQHFSMLRDKFKELN